MHQANFIDSQLNENSNILITDLDQMSSEGKKFLQLMNKEVDRRDKHSKLLLPIWNQDANL